MSHIDTSPVVLASLWIPPGGDALTKIQHAMRRGHERGGGPPFRPHVTLLSGIERTQADAELKLKHLAAQIAPFTIELARIESRDEYFRCLYAAVAPSKELAAARQLAYDVFEMNPPPPYEPHLSLVYGDLDEKLKGEIAAELGGRLDLSFSVSSLQLVNASRAVPVTGWKSLAERPLGA